MQITKYTRKWLSAFHTLTHVLHITISGYMWDSTDKDTKTEDRFWQRISLWCIEYKSSLQEFVHSVHIDFMMDWKLINYHQKYPFGIIFLCLLPSEILRGFLPGNGYQPSAQTHLQMFWTKFTVIMITAPSASWSF